VAVVELHERRTKAAVGVLKAAPIVIVAAFGLNLLGMGRPR
jgi:hypothetical protein